MNRFLRGLLLRLGALLLALGNGVASAAVVTVVLSEDSAPYHETADAIEAALGGKHTVIRVPAGKFAPGESSLSRASLLVAVGVKAGELIAERGGKTPVLAVLVTEDWFQQQGSQRLSSGGRSVGAVVLEQPLSRQLRLVKVAFPKASKVGAVVGRKNVDFLQELQKQAVSQDLTVVGKVVESESTLVATLGDVLAEADLLLAAPDADVLNRNTVQSVLMTTYRYRDPVVGYSSALTRAGALVSLFSTPSQIGRQAGEIAGKALNGGGTVRLPSMLWPKYFSISINDHVSRSLGITVPGEDQLLRELRGEND